MSLPNFSSSKKFKLDHSYDDHMYNIDPNDNDSISTISGGSKLPSYADDPSLIFETAEEKKSRRRSHWVAYATVCVMTVGFSCVLSGVWPYLQALDDSKTKESLGWVVAGNPLGQLIASPIVGYLGNRFGSIRGVCYVTVIFFTIGNAIYSILPYLPTESVYYVMILSRFIVGISSANVTLCRSYLASSTTIKERTKGISLVSAAQSLGFVLGPIAQTIFTVSFPSESKVEGEVEGEADTTQFVATSWFATSLGVINFIILTPWVFQEYDIASKELKMIQHKKGKDEVFDLPKTDYAALIVILYCFFMNMFVYVLLETLMEPFVADQYQWCNDYAVVVVGISFCAAGILSLCMFFVAVRVARMIDERKILLFFAFIPIAIGVFLFIPWGPGTVGCCTAEITTTPAPTKSSVTSPFLQIPNITPPSRSKPENFNYLIGLTYLVGSSDNEHDKFCDDPYECIGCPCKDQPWCDGYKKLPLAQFYVAFVIVIAGYPFGVAMSNSIFSKILGPVPQGTWMGILTSCGSLARVLGPVFVSYLYANQGTIPTFSAILGGMVIAILLIILFFKKIVPMKLEKPEDQNRT